LKEKFMRFMYGRYGVDTLGKYSLGAGLATMVLSIVFDSYTLSLLSWFFIILTYFRMFSRNLYKRSSENQTFLNKTYKLRTWFGKQKNMMAQRKTHHIYRCPGCKQKIRVPRGKGRIEIRCPKCHTTFIKNS
jgi:DNA-directed RNA polymerase subunit RPC12/RpoP